MHTMHGRDARHRLTGRLVSPYMLTIGNIESRNIMTRGIFSGRLLGLLDIFGSAIHASTAVDNRRAPHPRDLKRLGIDPNQFRDINRY
jgi:hypothetical protein